MRQSESAAVTQNIGRRWRRAYRPQMAQMTQMSRGAVGGAPGQATLLA
jgi:hypothetical protein